MQLYFRCEEGKEDEARQILMKKGVKAVTDMLYEARVAAVVRIEAAKRLRCARKDAISLYPNADEYDSVNLFLLIPYVHACLTLELFFMHTNHVHVHVGEAYLVRLPRGMLEATVGHVGL